MKIRQSFISNSSSTSFIVAWPKKIENFEDVKKYIMYTEHANIILDLVLRQETGKLAEEDWIINTLVHIIKRNTIVFEIYDKYTKENNKYDWEGYEKEVNELARINAIKFIKNNTGKFFYLFKFSDNDGQIASDMEHGNIFKKLSHLAINEH